jgi:hypothetical protein
MPWTIKDVPSFTKKAKTTAQKKKWVSIANGVLKDCQSKGGKDCEAKAIRVANSKFSGEGFIMKEETKVPKGALRFVDQGCHAHVEFSEDGENKTPKLKMVAYSGGIIKGHWFWDNLAIDLNGIEFKQSRFPVLENHDTSRKVAVISKPVIEDGKLVAPENAKFLSTPESQEFQRLSAEGFPYQSSIYAKPSNIERLEENATAEVNGYKMKGPGSIWRKCEFKEMSVCVFGWDSNTKASAFSKEETEDIEYVENTISATIKLVDDTKTVKRKEVKKMDSRELMSEHGDLIQEIIDEALSKANEKFAAEKKDLEAKLATEKATNTEMSERVQKLEKNDLIRREQEFKSKADSIWSKKLSESEIPTHLYGKVSGYVHYAKFVKDDSFDNTAFTAAVEAEIKDWEDKGVVNTVIGAGFSEKEVDSASKGEEAKLLAENASIIDRLVKKSGVQIPKQT